MGNGLLTSCSFYFCWGEVDLSLLPLGGKLNCMWTNLVLETAFNKLHLKPERLSNETNKNASATEHQWAPWHEYCE